MGEDSGMPELVRWLEYDRDKGGPYARVLSMVEGLAREHGTDAGLISALEAAAEGGDPDAQYAIGYALQYGLGIDRCDGEALAWYEKAMSQDHPLAFYRVGVWHMLGTAVPASGEKALRLLGRASDLGVAEASKEIAWMYHTGTGVRQSSAKDFEWTLKAAEQGDPEAQNDAGYCYGVGRGVEKSLEKAAMWYRRGAENGNAYAQTNLAHLYSQGLGVERSDEEAFGWYLKAAKQGREVAQDNVGQMYELGLGVEQSYEQAARWYAKAANKGEALAMLHLGRLFEAGLGVAQSIENAKTWYGKAAYNDVEAGREAMLRLDPEWEEEEPRFVEDCYDDCDEDEEDPPFISGWTMLDPPEEFSGRLDPDAERELFDQVAPRFDPTGERFPELFLCEFVRCLLNYAYRPSWKDKPEIDLGKAFETVSRRLSGRMKVGKIFRGFYYSDCITVEMEGYLVLSLTRNVQEQLEVWVDEAPRDSDCIPDRYCTVAEGDLEGFCDLLEYVQDNLGRWKAMAEERASR
ncbi:MAG: SEL1-like repeat protein [Candidatus Methanomethylophilaceae archaeon]|nr:SEL1-like repeat protein [Candidatus Methanomethylophilaceae archaeon]